jgi:DNA-binding XRE family transcriptional regulator
MEKIRNRSVSVRQMRAARALVGWSRDDLAKAAGLAEITVKRAEAASDTGEVGGRTSTADKIVAALETAGVIFVDENGEGAGVRLRKDRG